MRKNAADTGELTEQVTLRSQTPTDDGAGGQTVAWADYATVFARIRPLSGNERQAAQRTAAAGMFLVVIRNRDDVKENHVVRWGARDLNVRFVRARGPRDLFLEIECELGAAI